MGTKRAKARIPDWAQRGFDEILGVLSESGKVAPPPHDRLFHFTDAASLIGILKTHTLWATNARCLNDASEVRYGIELIRERLRMTVAEAGQRPKRLQFRKLALRYLDLDKVPASVRFLMDPFVVSFSETEEESYHWLNYGRGGDGYALGFQASKLEIEGFELRPVVYLAAEQTNMVDDAVTKMEECLLTNATTATTADEYRAFCRIAAHRFAVEMWGFASRFKHESFRGEKEWRLISFNIEGKMGEGLTQVELAFRPNGNRVVPYYIVDYGKRGLPLPLSSIVLGSKVERSIATSSIKYLFREHKHKAVPVAVSAVHLQ